MIRHWKVGELAKLTGLTIRTLRFYDEIGLFSPSARSDTGHRLYSEADVLRLQQILSIKQLGLSLDEVKSVVNGERFSPLETVLLQIARLKDNIRMEQNLLSELEYVSSLMKLKEPVTVEEFIKLLEMMKKSHGTYITERRMTWERRLDMLGNLVDGHSDSLD
ncbi:MerR family transcriptional regulator [Alicyclobacillus sp. SO9]|uniref:MerR family transcriptional regulator n=1 Tax=Alicyclobacillus sp. SO9 TaxID=2665646 RepID=UPI0018E6F66B|nr:MerR family transcriptional regulator [Alicyclobacillus sp. SO9]QQE78321.1 MerR family transcriptional regulator [Alicyclobacillus sp. SO9]